MIGLGGYSVNQDCTYEWLNLTEQNNIVWGGQPADRAGYTVQAAPEAYTWFTLFSKSARWAGMLTIYNRDSAENVSVTLTGLANGSYRMRNAQNPAETWAFEYAGEAVSVPTAWTSAARIGGTTHPPTWPVFGALMVEVA